MDWVLDNIRELLLILLGVIMVLWLNRKLSFLFGEANYHKLSGLNSTNLLSYSLEVGSLKWVSLDQIQGISRDSFNFSWSL